MLKCIACSNIMTAGFGGKVHDLWTCKKCGLECIAPQPDDKTLAEIYTASYFAHYLNSIDPQSVRTMKRATYKRQLARLKGQGSAGTPKRLLDCGAATGFLCELATELGWEAYAIEISQFGAEACRKLLGSERVHHGEAQTAAFAGNREGRFEAITMFDFIEHVRDPLQVLKWAKERLSTSGTLLLTTPRIGSVSRRLMRRQWFHYNVGHLWLFSPESIRTLLRGSGFKDIEVHALPKAVTLGYALAHYARRTAYNRYFSPLSGFVNAILPEQFKRWQLWFYLGEMTVVARA
jgi:2-polyprenyl-3-methyl-5-hydroxy-6-metoxy-1,4-benzoquinol methylase